MVMRVLVLSNYYPPFELGGWGQLTFDVAQRLQGRGHDVLVLTSRHRQDDLTVAEPGVRRLLHLESPDHITYRPTYTMTHRRHEAENRVFLQQAVADLQPDVIYVNGMWNLPVSLAQEAERLRPGRVIYYMASYWPAETDAHTAYWQDLADGWRRWPKQVAGALLTRGWIQATPRNALDFRRVLCVSDYLRRRIVAEAEIPAAKTRVVHNGIDLDDFRQRPLPAPGDPLKILYAGRFSPDKGVHTILESLSHLQPDDLPPGSGVTLVGSGAPAYEARLKALAATLPDPDLVTFRGFVPRTEMPAILHDHNVLVFSSIWPEPLARMVQEAMAVGLIVVGTETGGTPEILFDGENGLTFPAGDAAVLAEKLRWLAHHADQLPTLAGTARQTVERRFTLVRMIDELEQNFRDITGNVAAPDRAAQNGAGSRLKGVVK